MRFLKYTQNLALDGSHVLSYGTKVARVNHVNRVVHTLGYWSQTTSKHVEEMMDGHSKYGALSQMVLVDAIRIGLQSIHGAKEHFDAKTNEAKAAGRVSIINWQAWWECSGELLDKYNNKYG